MDTLKTANPNTRIYSPNFPITRNPLPTESKDTSLVDTFTSSQKSEVLFYSPKMFQQQPKKFEENKDLKDTLNIVDKSASAVEDATQPLKTMPQVARQATRDAQIPSILKRADQTVESLDTLKSFSKGARWLKPVAGLGDAAQLFITGVEIYDARSNPNLTRDQKAQQVGKSMGSGLGSIVGGTIGSSLGASFGATVGVIGGPVGVAVGGVLGSVVGGAAGDWVGGKVGEYLGDTSAGKWVGNQVLNGIDYFVGPSDDKPEPKPLTATSEVTVMENFSGKVETQSVSVNKPENNSSREIRNNVLYSLGYSDEDIAAYDRQYPTSKKDNRPANNGFYVGHNNGTQWATPDEVKTWPLDAGGNVQISVSAESMKHLKEFYDAQRRGN
jgi:hypothetical protein